MASKASRDKRLKFFRLGNTHCPICLVQFTEESTKAGRGVTLEHAPPKAMGRASSVPSRANPATVAQAQLRTKPLRGARAPPELQFEHKRNLSAAHGSGRMVFRLPACLTASAVARLRRRRKENSAKGAIVAATSPMQFDKPTTLKEISMSLKMPDKRHVELSYLRSAYLLVFSLLGRKRL